MSFTRAADGTRIRYEVRGAGPRVLVFLHAWGTSGSYFEETIEHLDPASFRAISIDLRGHGDSDKPDVELTWDLLARDVLAVADAAGARTFIAVGHSMGGKLTQYLPLVAPERIEGLVLVASPSAGELPAPEFVRAWVDLAGDGEALVADSVVRFLRAPVPDAVLRRAADEAAKIPRIYLERTLELISATSFDERIVDVQLPVLVVSTEDDAVHVTERDILVGFPHAKVEIVESGAEIPMEAPATVARLIGEFVASLDR